jgi:riboflavin kinase/FMN adenylyltransferase
VHLFDFDRDIYGRQVDVRFMHKLRDEQRFASFEELKYRIFRDLDDARAWLRGPAKRHD